MKYINLSLVLIFLGALPLIQCTKEDSLFQSSEEKILGQWRFEQVKYFPNFSLTGDDRTQEFQDKILDFRKNQKVLKRTTETGEEWEGTWRMSHHVTYSANASGETVERIDALLVNKTDHSVIPLTFDHLHVTHKKVRSTEYVDGGRIEIRLSRP